MKKKYAQMYYEMKIWEEEEGQTIGDKEGQTIGDEEGQTI
jgi:hypothetical protein